MARAINILISKWSTGQRLFIFLTIVTCWSRSTTVQFLCSNWSKFDKWFMQKIYTASWNLFTLTAEANRVFCQLVMFYTFSTGCIKWNTAAINSLVLFMAGLFIEFLVDKYAACKSWKSDFGWHRFRFSPCWMRVEKSLKRFWPYLIAFRSCISNGKPE